MAAINVKLCQGKDVLERMNYLYQASHLMATRSRNRVAASCYGNIMVACAKKAVLRMNPDVKRTVCKCCQSPLIPGETARVRLVSKPTKMVKWTCLTCNATKKFPTKSGYKLWAHQPEALVESFDYTPKTNKVSSSNDLAKTDKVIQLNKGSSLSIGSKASNTILSSEANNDNSLTQLESNLDDTDVLKQSNLTKTD